ncbi:U2 small nuclear ribonucleoprotein B'' [Phlyctochytrium planicorne]|nr:U2 small nuclear ribonucleoprotein B'' [Phlyctochytrium planicorne]
MTVLIPSHTLYVQSIRDKLKKHEIKKSLYHLFSQYGKVIDVVAVKKEKLRGQAFVVFSEIAEATAALRALQGFPFFGKALKLEYSKSVSNAVMLQEGRIIPPKAAKGKNAKGGKRAREEDGDEGRASKKVASEEAKEAAADEDDDEEMEMDEDDDEDDNESKPGAKSQSASEENPPHTILYATELPKSVTGSTEMLSLLFKQYGGFKEVRLVPTKPDIAFIEFESVNQAADAKAALQGFLIAKGHPLTLQFAKR